MGYGEQCADTDGMAMTENLLLQTVTISQHEHAELKVRREHLDALEAKLEATMADAQSLQCQNESLQRQNEHWQAECRRLSALLVEQERHLAQRMAMPANALRHSR